MNAIPDTGEFAFRFHTTQDSDLDRVAPMPGTGKPGGFAWWLATHGYSDRTAGLYVRTVRRVDKAVRARTGQPLNRLGDDQAMFELRTFAQTIPNTNASRSCLRRSVKAYWAYLGRKRSAATVIRAIPCPRKPQMVCKALEPGEIAKLLVTAREFGPVVYAMVCLMYYAGLRREEVVNVRWPDVGEGLLHVVGKGGVEAWQEIPPKLADAIVAIPRTSDGPWLFPGRYPGTHLALNTVNVYVKQLGAAIGLGQRLAPHMIRHSGVAMVNDLTGDLRTAQTFARHADPRTTAGYTRTTRARLQQAVLALDPETWE